MPHFLYYEVSSLTWSNAAWNTMMVDTASCKSMDGSFGIIIQFRESKSVSRVSAYSNKDKTLPLPWWVQSNVINVPSGSWLITIGNGVILRAQWWSLLADWAFGSGYNLIRLGEWKSLLLSPCTSFIPATIATSFMSLLDKDKGGWRKRLTGLYRIGHPIYLVVKIPVVGIHMGHKCLYGFAYSKRSTYILLPQISLSRIFNRVPPKSLIIQINYWPKSMNQYIIAHLDIYSSKQSAQSGTPPKDTLTGKIFLPHCPLEMSQRGAVVL